MMRLSLTFGLRKQQRYVIITARRTCFLLAIAITAQEYWTNFFPDQPQHGIAG
jgi:hypothetical protein